MSKFKCRVCGKRFFIDPLVTYCDMPVGAQHFPVSSELSVEKGVDIKVCQCSGCGLVQLANEPVPYHKDVIRASAFSEEMRLFRLEQFKEFIDQYALKHKKVIEIGCGRGEYLSLMNSFEVDVYGVEHNVASVEVCRQKNLKVSALYLDDETQQLPDAPFDAFFILNFLEHMPDPNTVLRIIKSGLSEGAIGMVEVPNFDETLKRNLFFDFVTDHLFYFTEETLAFTLRLNGFEVLEMRTVWHNALLSAVVRKRAPMEMKHFHKALEKFKDGIKGFLQQYCGRRIAVWGASHHALTILSMMKMQDAIVYVVDSAPFKQNHYTPVTHIPIVSPKRLKHDPVDVVIVMAAGYSDEVVSILKRDFGTSMTIAVLRDTELEVCTDAGGKT
jgi:2-polyprenyl-3-methyl-5-hydroxy-6-metoxy-1,4-benzoquinol methylase